MVIWPLTLHPYKNETGHGHMAVDLASLQTRDGARRVSAGPGGRGGEDFCFLNDSVVLLECYVEASSIYCLEYVSGNGG